jgi:CRISPR-associated endonuclease/helicase Cas3
MSFSDDFQELTGNPPFPWQESLSQRFISGRPDNIPASCNLPTGLGKTSVVAIWLIALANHPDRMPRRLVYVVNRRTVVDQTTTEVEKLRERLGNSPLLKELRKRLVDLCALPLDDHKDEPIAISTLRGQFADNREWSADPARPAVIVGTKFHDLGKRRVLWQRSIGNPKPTNWLAKSGAKNETARTWRFLPTRVWFAG